ncbi:hypothetical protein [Myceligenerans crystallogenes]|uniref:DsrE/DsrF-like family protein n=1 Tax=Myceligenerans crystallogenes TaxID=316335 RepID=A0ABP4ZPA0_9MICO
MSSVLIIVDRPFRGALERQFADAVHLARVAMLQFGTASILLTGQGVLLAAAAVEQGAAAVEQGAGAAGGVVGDTGERDDAVGHAPDGDAAGHAPDGDAHGAFAGARSLLAAMASGMTVLVDARAAGEYGLTTALTGHFELVPPERTLEELVTHDHVWYA